MTEDQQNFIKDVAEYVFTFSQFSYDVSTYIGCLFALESSYGSSTLAKEKHNYCGMKNPLVRISTALYAGVSGSDKVWATFSSLRSCVIDFLFCIQYHRPISSDYDTVEHFAQFISKFYCPENDYIDKINLIYQSFKSNQNGN